MKTPSDKLFLLISSLTRSEKRYFKRFSTIHAMKEGNSYLALFDAIEKQKTYDEEAIKLKLSKTRFVKYLSVEKAYLYNLVLRSLVVYGSGRDEYEEIIELFSKSKILFKKSIYNEALNYLNKAIAISVKEEYYPLALELEKWKRKILIKQETFYTKKTLDPFFKEMAEMALLERNIRKYQQANDLAFSYIITGHTARSKKDTDQIRETIISLLNKKEDPPLTTTSNRLKHQAAASYYYFTNNYKKYYIESAKAVEWAAKQSNKSEIYFIALANFFNACVFTKNFQELFPIIKKLESIDTSNNISEQFKRNVLFDTKLLAAMECCEFDSAITFLKKNEATIFKDASQNVGSNLLNSAFNAAWIYFIKGNYSAALKWLNTFFFTKKAFVDLRRDTYGEASILYILLHYELKNEDLLKTLIKSTYKSLLKQEKLYGFEKTILDFIRKELSHPKKRKELLAAFSALRTRLLKLKEEKYESAAFQYFDLTPWLESKIENIPLERVMKERLQSSR